MSQERWTILRLLQWTEEFFRQKSIENPRLEAQILLAHVLQCERIALYTRTDEEPVEPVKARFRELIRKRADGCPVAYLVGYREFFTYRFQVNPHVLIPRPETELLVLKVLESLKSVTNPNVLDAGTGSGCIAISLAKQLPKARIDAVDFSMDALTVAKHNAEKLGVSDRVQFLHSDWLAGLTGDRHYDRIVSNPPYIGETERGTLAREVREHEPAQALFAGEDGLMAYQRLIPQAMQHLKPGGQLWLEIGYQQKEAVLAIMAEAGFQSLQTYTDDAKLPRIVRGQKAEP